MPRRSVFVPAPGFADELVRAAQMEPPMATIAEAAAEAAKQAAPERLRIYKRSIQGVAGQREDGVVVGRVLSTDFKAGWIEFGTARPTEEFAPLRRGVEQVTGRGVGA